MQPEQYSNHSMFCTFFCIGSPTIKYSPLCAKVTVRTCVEAQTDAEAVTEQNDATLDSWTRFLCGCSAHSPRCLIINPVQTALTSIKYRKKHNFIRDVAVAYPGILFGAGSTNSVEDRGQRERGSGGGSPIVRGSGGSCNLVQEISFRIVKFS